jgi:hypothetical protein
MQSAMAFHCASASFTGQGFPSPTFINYLNQLSVRNNTVSAPLSTSATGTITQYTENGLWISSTSNDPVYSTMSSGIEVSDNLFYRVFRGIGLSTVNANTAASPASQARKVIARNRVILDEDDVTPIPPKQTGIIFCFNKGGTPSSPTLSTSCLHSIESNTLSMLNASTISNTNIALIQVNSNPAGSIPSPFVICNDPRT